MTQTGHGTPPCVRLLLEACIAPCVQARCARANISESTPGLAANTCISNVYVCLAAETALARLELNNLEKVFAVNTFGPILVSKVRHLHESQL